MNTDLIHIREVECFDLLNEIYNPPPFVPDKKPLSYRPILVMLTALSRSQREYDGLMEAKFAEWYAARHPPRTRRRAARST